MIRRLVVLLALLAATASVSTPAHAATLYVSCAQISISFYSATYQCGTDAGYAAYTWTVAYTYGSSTFNGMPSEIEVTCMRDQYLQVGVTVTSAGVTSAGVTEPFRCNAGEDIQPS